LVHLEKGMKIGDMLGGKKIYPNRKVGFVPEKDDFAFVYTHERIEAREDGTRSRVMFTLTMPTSCCNYALLIARAALPKEVPKQDTEVPPQKVGLWIPSCITPHQGTHVPRSRSQDCAMPGRVLDTFHDAVPASAASYESAPVQNSEPFPAKGFVPFRDAGEDVQHWLPRPDGDNGKKQVTPPSEPSLVVKCSVGLLSIPDDLHAVCSVEPNACLAGKLICLNSNP
jgi:hypothetical protein